MRELYRLLLSNEEMDNEEKIDINHTLLSAIVAGDYPIEENGLYLRVTNTEDADKMDVELWYDRKDEDGNISVKNISNDKGQILDVLHKKYLEKKESKGKNL